MTYPETLAGLCPVGQHFPLCTAAAGWRGLYGMFCTGPAPVSAARAGANSCCCRYTQPIIIRLPHDSLKSPINTGVSNAGRTNA